MTCHRCKGTGVIRTTDTKLGFPIHSVETCFCRMSGPFGGYEFFDKDANWHDRLKEADDEKWHEEFEEMNP